MINRILHSCSCITEFIKLVGENPPTHLINSIIHEHSCKILYDQTIMHIHSVMASIMALLNSKEGADETAQIRLNQLAYVLSGLQF